MNGGIGISDGTWEDVLGNWDGVEKEKSGWSGTWIWAQHVYISLRMASPCLLVHFGDKAESKASGTLVVVGDAGGPVA